MKRIKKFLIYSLLLSSLTLSSFNVVNAKHVDPTEPYQYELSSPPLFIQTPFPETNIIGPKITPEPTKINPYIKILGGREVIILDEYYKNISDYLNLNGDWFEERMKLEKTIRQSDIETIEKVSKGLIKKEPDRNILWRDEQYWPNWRDYPNSCGLNALWIAISILYKKENIPLIDFNDIVKIARRPVKGYWDPYCGRSRDNFDISGIPYNPTKNPDGTIFKNPACISSSVLAEIATPFLDNIGLKPVEKEYTTAREIKEWIDQGRPVIALVRVGFLEKSFGHYVVIVGYYYDKDGKLNFLYSDYYPGEYTWRLNLSKHSSAIRCALVCLGSVDENTFFKSAYSNVDRGLDPIKYEGYNGWTLHFEEIRTTKEPPIN